MKGRSVYKEVEGILRQQPRANLRYYPGISPEGEVSTIGVPVA
jgi:hypothetical protein